MVLMVLLYFIEWKRLRIFLNFSSVLLMRDLWLSIMGDLLKLWRTRLISYEMEMFPVVVDW